MKTKTIILLIALFTMQIASAQEQKAWSLANCIDYALEQNIQVRQSILTNLSNQVNKEQAEAQKLPSLNATINQNLSWANTTNSNTGSTNFSSVNSSSYGVNSSITLYNGKKLNNLIKQAELDWQSGIYDSETIKESITLSILNAFLQVLFNEESIKNAEKQIESTKEQLTLAEARLASGIISRSDYLQVKSQLASEKLSLANAKSQFLMAKVNLMQLMELPVSDGFTVIRPGLNGTINKNISPVASDIFATALGIKPEVKSAEYQKESAAIDEKVAQAGYYPTVSASAGISTAYSSINSGDYFGQLNDQVTPTLGISISIPIFQKKQVKSSVSLAKINYKNAELQEIDTRNQLRKEIEQACVDVVSAQSEYEASVEQYESNQESYTLAEEKFNNGLINSVDFLYEKTNLIVAESTLLQSKFSLIFNYKILDFYIGNPIEL